MPSVETTSPAQPCAGGASEDAGGVQEEADQKQHQRELHELGMPVAKKLPEFHGGILRKRGRIGNGFRPTIHCIWRPFSSLLPWNRRLCCRVSRSGSFHPMFSMTVKPQSARRSLPIP